MQTNLNYLTERILEAGFEHLVIDDLRGKIAEELPRFILQYDIGKRASATLYIVRWKDSPFYHLSKFRLAVCQKTNTQTISRDFYTGSKKDPPLTLPEALRLLKGQCIYKNFLHNRERLFQFNSWLKLDFNSTDGNGNFSIRYFNIKIKKYEKNNMAVCSGDDWMHSGQTIRKSADYHSFD